MLILVLRMILIIVLTSCMLVKTKADQTENLQEKYLIIFKLNVIVKCHNILFFCSKVSCVTGGLVCYSDNGLVECCTGYECVPIGTLGYCLEVRYRSYEQIPEKQI